MKKIFIFLLGSVSLLHGMQAPGPNLTVDNKTIWDIRVVYEQDGKVLTKDLKGREQAAIFSPRTITKMQIVRSGLFGTLVQPELQSDEAKKIQRQVKLYPKEDLVLTIALPEGIKESLGEFTTSIAPVSTTATVRSGKNILEHFPIVRRIIEDSSGIKGFYGLRSPSIEAYNLLGFTNVPSKREIEEAYEEKRVKLAEIAGGGYAYAAADRARAEDAVEMLDTAYKVLTQPENQIAKTKLQQLIQERFIAPKKY